MTIDDDGPRKLRVVTAEAPRPSTTAAERARRYRARQRGEDVPRRKPGPMRSAAAERESRLRDENAELSRKLADAQLQVRLATGRLARQHTHRVEWLCGELLSSLGSLAGADDSAETRELLRDVATEIDSRHDSWPEP